MEITVKQVTPWSRALDAARWTVHKESLGGKEPSDKFKKQILLAEHSPIREVVYDIAIKGIPQWVSVHLVRHHEGVQFYVGTQREDRVKLSCKRDDLPQGSLVDVKMTINAQALINISRKRLCTKAAPETRAVWKAVITELSFVDPIMASKCVPECVYRGFCPEMQSCRWCDTHSYRELANKYREV
jgi:hypothetical protein